MKRPIRIRFTGMETSSALFAVAHSLAHGLTWDESEILACWVGIRLDPEQTSPGRSYSVRIDVTVPGHEIITTRVPHDSVDLALHYAFNDVKRQLAEIDPRIHHAEYAVTIPGMLVPPEDLASKGE